MSYTSIVGRVLKMNRILAGLTLSDMATKTSGSTSGWSRIEAGETPLTVEKLHVAARVLKLTPAELIRAADELAKELEVA